MLLNVLPNYRRWTVSAWGRWLKLLPQPFGQL
jgi:hypothetical protein